MQPPTNPPKSGRQCTVGPPSFPAREISLQRACSRSFPNSGSSQFIFGPVASCCRNPWKTGPGVHRVPPPPFPPPPGAYKFTKIRAGSAPLELPLARSRVLCSSCSAPLFASRQKTGPSVHLWSLTPLVRRAPRAYFRRRWVRQVELGRSSPPGTRPSSPARSAPYKTTISRGLFRGLLRDNSAAIPSPLGAK